jgi:hypothetical protein
MSIDGKELGWLIIISAILIALLGGHAHSQDVDINQLIAQRDALKYCIASAHDLRSRSLITDAKEAEMVRACIQASPWKE